MVDKSPRLDSTIKMEKKLYMINALTTVGCKAMDETECNSYTVLEIEG